MTSQLIPIPFTFQLHSSHSDRKSTRLNSSHLGISYAVFCLKKKKKIIMSKWNVIYLVTAMTLPIEVENTNSVYMQDRYEQIGSQLVRSVAIMSAVAL